MDCVKKGYFGVYMTSEDPTIKLLTTYIHCLSNKNDAYLEIFFLPQSNIRTASNAFAFVRKIHEYALYQ